MNNLIIKHPYLFVKYYFIQNKKPSRIERVSRGLEGMLFSLEQGGDTCLPPHRSSKLTGVYNY